MKLVDVGLMLGMIPIAASIAGGTGPTSDTGWGCMLRCGQMILGQALMCRHLGRGETLCVDGGGLWGCDTADSLWCQPTNINFAVSFGFQTGDGSEDRNKERSTSAFSMHSLIKKTVIIPSIRLVSVCKKLVIRSRFHFNHFFFAYLWQPKWELARGSL